MQIKILADGGKMAPSPALSQKLGPLGLNINLVLQKVNEATKEFEGLKVPVELDVNTSTREFEVKVFSPPVSELLKKELSIEKGSGKQDSVKVANASIEQIISVAKTKMQNMLSRDLKAATKTVAGTCVSLGILIESKNAVEVCNEIAEGKYDKEILSGLTETPKEKREELDKFFEQVKAKQDVLLKQEQAAKDAESAKTATATPAVPAATPTKAEKKKK
jgi:large subunit ribosomal protein L11